MVIKSTFKHITIINNFYVFSFNLTSFFTNFFKNAGQIKLTGFIYVHHQNEYQLLFILKLAPFLIWACRATRRRNKREKNIKSIFLPYEYYNRNIAIYLDMTPRHDQFAWLIC